MCGWIYGLRPYGWLPAFFFTTPPRLVQGARGLSPTVWGLGRHTVGGGKSPHTHRGPQAHCFLRAMSSALAWMEFRWSWGGAVGPGLGSVSVYISPMSPKSLPCISPISRLDDLVDGRGERVEAGELLHGVRGRGRVRVGVRVRVNLVADHAQREQLELAHAQPGDHLGRYRGDTGEIKGRYGRDMGEIWGRRAPSASGRGAPA